MKKSIAVLLIAALLVSLLAGCTGKAGQAATETAVQTEAPSEAPTEAPEVDYGAWRVGLLSQNVTIAEQSSEQAVFDAAAAWCEARGIACEAYTPTESATKALTLMIDRAVEDGCKALLLPGWTLLDAIKKSAANHPDIYFILLDIAAESFGKSYSLPANVCCAIFREEVLGFLAGYTAVRLGCRHLCYMGTTKGTLVTRRGYGFVQGANAAAIELELEKEVAVEYVYANSLTADPAVAAYMEDMYRNKGVELCFTCDSVAESVFAAAQKVTGAKVIGADLDRIIGMETENSEPAAAASVLKNYEAIVQIFLRDLIERGFWHHYAAHFAYLGIVSGTDPEANYLYLAPSTRFDDGGFSESDYAAFIADLYAGKYDISDDAKNPPKVTIAVNYRGNIK